MDVVTALAWVLLDGRAGAVLLCDALDEALSSLALAQATLGRA